MKKSKINWEYLKAKYIEGYRAEDSSITYPTLEALALEAHIKPQTLRIKAGKENWITARNLYTKKITDLRQEKKSELLATESATLDSKCLETVNDGVDEIKRRFKLIKETKAGKSTDIAILAKALDSLQKIGRLAMGENTDQADHSIHIIEINKSQPTK